MRSIFSSDLDIINSILYAKSNANVNKLGKIEPDEVFAGKLWAVNTKKYVDNANYSALKYNNIASGTIITVHGVTNSGTSIRYPLFTILDSSGNIILNSKTIDGMGSEFTFKVPNNAASIIVNIYANPYTSDSINGIYNVELILDVDYDKLVKTKTNISDANDTNTINDNGYYIMSHTGTKNATGDISSSILYNTLTPGKNKFIQYLITENGRLLSRYNGDFNEYYVSKLNNCVCIECKTGLSADPNTGGNYVDSAYNIYLPYGDKKHIRIGFVHYALPDYSGTGSSEYKNGDTFRLSGGVIGTLASNVNNYTFTSEKTAITSGAWEMALYKNGTGSAQGTFHGNEKFSRCIIFVNNTLIANITRDNISTEMKEIPLTQANNIEIFVYGSIYQKPDEGTTSLSTFASFRRHYTITKDGIDVDQRHTFTLAGTHGAYVAMGCISREYTNMALCDKNLMPYYIGELTDSVISHYTDNVSYAKVYSNTEDVSLSMYVEPACRFHVQNTISGASYNKMYFYYKKETAAGETWHTTTHYRFNDDIIALIDKKVDAELQYKNYITPSNIHTGKLYRFADNSLIDNNLYSVYEYNNLKPGQRIKILGMMGSNNYPLYTTFDHNNNVVLTARGMIEPGSGQKTAEIVIPFPCDHIYVNTALAHTNNGVMLGEYVLVSDSRIDLLEESKVDALSDYVIRTPIDIQENHLFKSSGTLVEYNNYTAMKYSIEPNKNIKIVGVQPAATNLLYMIYDENNNLVANSENTIETGQGAKSIVITTPANSSYVWINTMNTINGQGVYYSEYIKDLPTILQSIDKPLSVTITTNGCTVSFGDFVFNIRKIGANNLMNIYSGYYKDALIFATNTDWIGPYNFYKASNAAGDYTGGTTGGNHAFKDDNDETTVKTAYTVSYEILADGKTLSSGTKSCNEVEIRWINKVMAGNTVKKDGTGEYCLEEHIRMIIDSSGTMNVDAYFEPLVDCTLNWYSGIQFAGSGFATKAYIPEYSNDVINISDITSIGGSNKTVVSRYKTIGDVVSCEMWIDRTYGLGTHNNELAVTGTANKSYLILQSYAADDMPIYAGKRYAWKGGYKFYKSI